MGECAVPTGRHSQGTQSPMNQCNGTVSEAMRCIRGLCSHMHLLAQLGMMIMLCAKGPLVGEGLLVEGPEVQVEEEGEVLEPGLSPQCF